MCVPQKWMNLAVLIINALSSLCAKQFLYRSYSLKKIPNSFKNQISQNLRDKVLFKNENKIKLEKNCVKCGIKNTETKRAFRFRWPNDRLPVLAWILRDGCDRYKRIPRVVMSPSPIISSVNHCVMNPTFRQRRSCLRRRKKRNEGKQGLRQRWFRSGGRERSGRHVSALIITFSASGRLQEGLQWKTKREKEKGEEKERKRMLSGTTMMMGGWIEGGDSEQARGFWVGGQREGSGKTDMGQVTRSPWLRALLLPSRDCPSSIQPPPHVISQPLLSVPRSDMKTTTTCPLCRSFDRRHFLIYDTYHPVSSLSHPLRMGYFLPCIVKGFSSPVLALWLFLSHACEPLFNISFNPFLVRNARKDIYRGRNDDFQRVEKLFKKTTRSSCSSCITVETIHSGNSVFHTQVYLEKLV